MKVLIACEESQEVCKAFRELGHEAYSCDILPCSGGHLEWHFQEDIFSVIEREHWDLMIAHPPCTFLCRNRARQNREENIKPDSSFFLKLWGSNIDKVCIENPLPSKMSGLPHYTQIIQPYQFGHDHSKKTCLWLRGLSLLQPTNIIEISYITTKNGYRYTKGWYEMPRTSKARSRTFEGIADAMAEQWGQLTVKAER